MGGLSSGISMEGSFAETVVVLSKFLLFCVCFFAKVAKVRMWIQRRATALHGIVRCCFTDSYISGKILGSFSFPFVSFRKKSDSFVGDAEID